MSILKTYGHDWLDNTQMDILRMGSRWRSRHSQLTTLHVNAMLTFLTCIRLRVLQCTCTLSVWSYKRRCERVDGGTALDRRVHCRSGRLFHISFVFVFFLRADGEYIETSEDWMSGITSEGRNG
jgi:hypothetical protein